MKQYIQVIVCKFYLLSTTRNQLQHNTIDDENINNCIYMQFDSTKPVS